MVLSYMLQISQLSVEMEQHEILQHELLSKVEANDEVLTAVKGDMTELSAKANASEKLLHSKPRDSGTMCGVRTPGTQKNSR